MAERSYFDWNATTPLRPEVTVALADALAVTGNPSSVHAEGRAARKLVERAREQVAQLVGARPADVIFTGSGTEANMLALTPAIETAGEKRPRDRLLMSAIEHSSVRAGGRFSPDAIEDIPVDADGRVNLAALAEAVSKASRPLVSLMLANNEFPWGIIEQHLIRVQPSHEVGLGDLSAFQLLPNLLCCFRVHFLISQTGHPR